ncbi:hypothetical protein [Lactobacillus crispatus]|uniref:hypothetical protein n=1 Tax=Lactobacillus crispatus TaxID=47770 RepID=UPI0022AC5D5A|nr:hypothetical protein [Lactobacillus crispatus]MCZ3846392.1 hypothetical protein [Lactobacillus crispatus]MCZ3848660.1 hypothetical protein [Lactobacillus crispatus]MCZ3854597.1 hypothetical protein [Lactobacillus crispatus]MCZ3856874.1 hypothetical protein [Lactobacillus crispatus]MCZ3859164.1 hypothetical protein [Lactobacillus crispatus]
MADETQVAPVASAETATQEKPTKLYVYYYSNPDGATKDERCHEILTEVPFDVVPWRMHKEAPDASMSDPVWDNNLNGGLGAWKENSGEAQGQILAEAQAKIEELDQKSEQLDQANAKVDQAMKTIQTAQQNNTEQNEMLTKGMAALMKSQKDNNKLMMSMQKVMENLAKQNKDVTTPEAPATDTSTQSTNKQENGGN